MLGVVSKLRVRLHLADASGLTLSKATAQTWQIGAQGALRSACKKLKQLTRNYLVPWPMSCTASQLHRLLAAQPLSCTASELHSLSAAQPLSCTACQLHGL